jgi:EAL domain-containing protein (putative c-di-GMP-specific phosphodiesterase class I)
VTEENLYAFDQSCRVQAITMASKLRLPETGAKLSINFLPGAVYSPKACIQLTLLTAHSCQFPLDRLIFEITESERVRDAAHLQAIVNEYKSHGFAVAIDDFGADYANLNLLANLSANVLKLDMNLIRNLHTRPRAQAIVDMLVQFAARQSIDIIAEGVETMEEYAALRHCGVQLMQGYLQAKPEFEALPKFTLNGLPAGEAFA